MAMALPPKSDGSGWLHAASHHRLWHQRLQSSVQQTSKLEMYLREVEDLAASTRKRGDKKQKSTLLFSPRYKN